MATDDAVEHVNEELVGEEASREEVPGSVCELEQAHLPIYLLDVVVNVWHDIIAPGGDLKVCIQP